MYKLTLATIALCFVMSGAVFAADGYKLDVAGKCHAADGKFAKAEMCKTAGPTHTYKLDAQKKCRDEMGKFAKAGLCKA